MIPNCTYRNVTLGTVWKGADANLNMEDVKRIKSQKVPYLLGKWDPNDAASIEKAVQASWEKEGREKSPFFYFRPRKSENGTFAVGIQTPHMRKMLEMHGNRLLCMDTTHGILIYRNFVLGTILVVDETGHGEPAAQYLVSGENEEEMRPIFEALKERCSEHLIFSILVPTCVSFLSFLFCVSWNGWKIVIKTTNYLCTILYFLHYSPMNWSRPNCKNYKGPILKFLIFIVQKVDCSRVPGL